MNQDIHHIGDLYPTVLESMRAASLAIMDIYHSDFSTQIKSDGSPVTQADLASSKILRQGLEKLALPILGEEAKKAPFEERKNWEYYWCIDPLDGTKEFIKQNDEFAICIALIHDNRSVFGAICSPVTKEVIFGGEGFGIFTTTLDYPEKLTKIQTKKSNYQEGISIVISRSHDTREQANQFIDELEEEFGKVHLFSKGSALKFFDLAVGKADIYARFGPTMEWDIAAGHCILRELGGEILSIKENEPLRYNKESLFNLPFIAYSTSSLIPTKHA